MTTSTAMMMFYVLYAYHPSPCDDGRNGLGMQTKETEFHTFCTKGISVVSGGCLSMKDCNRKLVKGNC